MAFKDSKGRCHLNNGKFAKKSACKGKSKRKSAASRKSTSKRVTGFLGCICRELKGTHPGTQSKARKNLARAAKKCSK